MLKNKSKGFTLVELLMVITTITIFASIVFINAATIKDKARKTTALVNFDQITKAINLYYNGWPQAESGEGCSEDGCWWYEGETPPFVPDPYPNWDASYYCDSCQYDLDIWDDDEDGTFGCGYIDIVSASGNTFISKNIACDDCPDLCGDYSYGPGSAVQAVMSPE